MNSSSTTHDNRVHASHCIANLESNARKGVVALSRHAFPPRRCFLMWRSGVGSIVSVRIAARNTGATWSVQQLRTNLDLEKTLAISRYHDSRHPCTESSSPFIPQIRGSGIILDECNSRYSDDAHSSDNIIFGLRAPTLLYNGSNCIQNN